MITTAKLIIKRSLRLISATAAGEEPTADEFEDCFNALTTMAEAWDIEKLMSTVSSINEYEMLSGASSFSIGPTGDFVVSQIPAFVGYVYISSANLKYEIPIAATRKEFDDEVQSSPSGWPSICYYTKHDPSSAVSRLEFSSTFPDSAYVKFGVSSRGSVFPDLDTEIDLPPGLKRAFEYNLAVEVAPEFQAQPSQLVLNTSIESKAQLKLHNLAVDELQVPAEFALIGHAGFDIRSGE